MNEFRVRLAKITDLNNICVIENDSFEEPYSAALIAMLLLRCRGSFFVATNQSGKLVGYCACLVNRKSAHLISIAVPRDHRRKGVGSALLGTLLRNLEARGVEGIYLEVKVQNKEAIALYLRFGFVEDAVVEKYYADGSAAVRMHLSLNKQAARIIPNKR